jgi:hypothetical protein
MSVVLTVIGPAIADKRFGQITEMITLNCGGKLKYAPNASVISAKTN